MKKHLMITCLTLLALPVLAWADIDVPMTLVNAHGLGQPIGHITLSDSAYGIVLTPNLNGLPAGVHGFHLHMSPSCEPSMKDGKPVAAGSAGGHWDPQHTEHHGMPWATNAHMGDLPPLAVNADGSATQPMLAPRFKDIQAFRHHALVIHAGGDNHSDNPAPLGGGGARLACGVIQ